MLDHSKKVQERQREEKKNKTNFKLTLFAKISKTCVGVPTVALFQIYRNMNMYIDSKVYHFQYLQVINNEVFFMFRMDEK